MLKLLRIVTALAVLVFLVSAGVPWALDSQTQIHPSLYRDTTNKRLGITEGLTLRGGQLVASALATPGAPTVTPQGTTGSTTYTYKIVATNGAGVTAASAGGSTATGNATLSSTNFNRLTWAAVTGATGYKVYRTVGGATQGLIQTFSTAVITLDDTGLAGGGETAETVNTTGRVEGTGTPGIYSPSTTLLTGAKVIFGQCALDGAATATCTLAVAFTSGTSYVCASSSETNTNSHKVVRTSATVVTVTSATTLDTGVVSLICAGN